MAAAWVIVFAALNQPPRWIALPSAGSGHLIIDGISFPVRETAEMTRRLRPGSRLRLEGTETLDLVSSGLLAIQLSPGTELALPAPPGRWLGRTARVEVPRGLLRVTTGKHFDGSRLAITTPEALVQVTGTTLVVMAESAGTCVCVLEGSARVGPHRGTMTRVPSGSRFEIARDGGAPKTGEMLGTERPRLQDLRDRMLAVMN